MTSLDSIDPAAGSLSTLSSGHGASSKDPKKVGEQFEALVVQTMLRTMRSTVEESGLFGGSGESIPRSLLDETIALGVARAGGFGLGKAIEHSLEQEAPGDKAGEGALKFSEPSADKPIKTGENEPPLGGSQSGNPVYGREKR